MSGFYTLSSQDQAERLIELARAALTQWNGRFSDLELFKNRENAVFSVRREDGSRVALRVHRAGYHDDEALRSELFWMAELGRSGIAVPPVIRAADGSLFIHAEAPGVPEVRQVDMLGWLSGGPIGADGRLEKSEQFRRIGALAAQLHAHGEALPLPKGFTRHRWDEEGLIGADPLWGRFWELPALTDDDRALLLEAREQAREDLATFGKEDARFGMIHADLIRDNVLEHEGRLQAIDFDDCGFGWYLFELATILNATSGEPDYSRLREALLAGYRSVRPLPDADLDHLPLFQFLRATTYLGWLQTRSETETARDKAPLLIGQCRRWALAYLGREDQDQRKEASR